MMVQQKQHSGFSLVELSIALVIIGLLVGGILGGRSLIRSAELQSITSEFQQYQSAVTAFTDLYKGMPGDLFNAQDIWGVRSPCSPSLPVGDAAGVCNGDGNGKVYDKNLANPCTSNTFSSVWREGPQFWTHLSRAGLIEGNYTGGIASTGPTVYWEAGVNGPAVKADKNLMWRPGHTACMPRFWTGDWAKGGHALFLGSGNGTYQPSPSENLPPEDMWSLDRKTDDARPGTGKMQVAHYPNVGIDCAEGDPEDYAEAVYNLGEDGEGVSCVAFFYLDAL